MNKFLAGIVAFLLLFAPHCDLLRNWQYDLAFNWDKVISEVMDAVQTHNVSALEAMMCKNIKQNVPGLPSEIGKLLDVIDGNISGLSEIWGRASYSESRGFGKQISQTSFAVRIKTSIANYHLEVVWESKGPSRDERGIREIGIYDEAQTESGYLVCISATEGVFDWHD